MADRLYTSPHKRMTELFIGRDREFDVLTELYDSGRAFDAPRQRPSAAGLTFEAVHALKVQVYLGSSLRRELWTRAHAHRAMQT
jgi:hypothetical protein